MKAFLTLLSTPDYLLGVLCMKKSLDDTGTLYPLYVGVSNCVPARIERVLVRHGMRPIRLPPHSVLDRTLHQGRHHWSNTFDKIHLFGLTDFSKFVYIDCDMMIMSNIDELFEQPHMSAVAAGKLVHPDYVRLNSGLMVIEPQEGLPECIGERLQEALDEVAVSQRTRIGDQDLINAYYADWPDSNLQLDEGYNVFHPHVDAYLDSGDYALPGFAEVKTGQAREIKVVHFIGPVKPWTVRGIAHHLLNSPRRKDAPAQHHAFVRYCKLMARIWGPGRAQRGGASAYLEDDPAARS